MVQVVDHLGDKDLKRFSASLPSDPKADVHSHQKILSLYQKCIDQMLVKLPAMFGRLPKARLRVVPTPSG
jgi:uncharacterized protein (DUF885 family)